MSTCTHTVTETEHACANDLRSEQQKRRVGRLRDSRF